MDRHRIIKSCLTLKRSEKIWDIRNQTSCEQANAVLFRHVVKRGYVCKATGFKDSCNWSSLQTSAWTKIH